MMNISLESCKSFCTSYQMANIGHLVLCCIFAEPTDSHVGYMYLQCLYLLRRTICWAQPLLTITRTEWITPYFTFCLFLESLSALKQASLLKSRFCAQIGVLALRVFQIFLRFLFP